jgi:endonuclease/exonuclease/phosphatase family metal-dependent hydrolase
MTTFKLPDRVRGPGAPSPSTPGVAPAGTAGSTPGIAPAPAGEVPEAAFVPTPGVTAPMAPAGVAGSKLNALNLKSAALQGAEPIAGKTRAELLPISPTDPAEPSDVVVMHWSLENLFDPANDPLKEDEEFTPERGYDEAAAAEHVDNYVNVIRQIAGGRGPDILTLTEVENRKMVDRMYGQIQNLGYQTVVHFDSEDERGIEQAVISKYPLLGQKYHQVNLPSGNATRGLLQADLDVQGHTLSVFVVHWPSMRGGQQAQVDRAMVGAQLRAIIGDLREADPNREVVVLGDFNENPGGGAQRDGLGSFMWQDSAKQQPGKGLYNTIGDLKDRKNALNDPNPDGEVQLGTHYFHPKNSWSTFDNMIISENLLDLNESSASGLAWVPGTTQVVVLPQLVTNMDTKIPDRFFDKNGRPIAGGESDHLPVTLRLRVVGEGRRPPSNDE